MKIGLWVILNSQMASLHRLYSYCTKTYPYFYHTENYFLSVVHFRTIQNTNC